MSDKKIAKLARIYALQNAIKFNGKAEPKAVIGKVISALSKESFSPKDIAIVVNSVVEEVNKLSLDQQKAELQALAPELLSKEKKERDLSLPDLPYAENGKVVTRFPPEPNGYLHIGHAKAAIIDYEYAKKYNGKFILRFDDTNPENAKLEFYDAQREDLIWLGIEWDKEYRTSDNIKKHYKLAEQLIKQGDAYVCCCKPEILKKCRFEGIECSCRSNDPGENLDKWKEMISSGVYGFILRLKGDMKSPNTAMRDPTLFRIIEEPHPVHGTKYRVWPTYDFAGPVEDSLSGVTHPFRTKEYELRDECYFRILDLLGLRKPHLMEFARLSIEGMPVSKRKIKPLIEKKLVSGFDDIRLPTLRGLKRRGIRPEAIRIFVLSQGISKVESTLDFGLLEAENRKIVDPIAKRYFFVPDPVPLFVEEAPNITKNIPLHPNNKNLGSRTIKTGNIFYLPKSDVDQIKIGDTIRLKDLYNVKILSKDDKVKGEYAGDRLIQDLPKIQWTTDDFVEIDVFKANPLFINDQYNEKSLEVIHGFAEKAIEDVKTDEIVQFERFGFVRIEKGDKGIVGYFSHK